MPGCSEFRSQLGFLGRGALLPALRTRRTEGEKLRFSPSDHDKAPFPATPLLRTSMELDRAIPHTSDPGDRVLLNPAAGTPLWLLRPHHGIDDPTRDVLELVCRLRTSGADTSPASNPVRPAARGPQRRLNRDRPMSRRVSRAPSLILQRMLEANSHPRNAFGLSHKAAYETFAGPYLRHQKPKRAIHCSGAIR